MQKQTVKNEDTNKLKRPRPRNLLNLSYSLPKESKIQFQQNSTVQKYNTISPRAQYYEVTSVVSNCPSYHSGEQDIFRFYEKMHINSFLQSIFLQFIIILIGKISEMQQSITSIQSLPYSKQELYQIPEQVASKNKQICFMMSLSIHEIVVVRDEKQIYLLSFSKKDNKLTVAEKWSMPDIIDIQKIVNSFFFVITKEHQMAIYFLTQTKDNKYSIQVVMGNLRYHSYFQHEVNKNVFQLQIWFTEINLFVYQFTTKRKVTVTEYVFQKEGFCYKQMNQENKGMIQTKCFVNSQDRFIIRKSNQKGAIYNIYPFPSFTYFIIGLPGKQQYLGFTDKIQFFPIFSKFQITPKKIQIPGETNPIITRIQIRHNMLILSIQSKDIKVAKDPVYIMNVSSNECKIWGNDEGPFHWIFGSDFDHIAGIVDKSWIRVAKVHKRFKIQDIQEHSQKINETNAQNKGNALISEQSSESSQNKFIRDQKPHQIYVDFNKNSKNKALKNLIKRNTFQPLNLSLQLESQNKKIRHQVVCFNHNSLLKNKSKNQLRINYLMENKKQSASMAQQTLTAKQSKQSLKAETEVKTGNSLFNQFFNPNSQYLASLKEDQRQAKLFESLEQMIKPNSKNSIESKPDQTYQDAIIKKSKRNDNKRKKKKYLQKIQTQITSIFNIVPKSEQLAEDAFKEENIISNSQQKSALVKKQSVSNNQKTLQQTIVFKPNFTDIFRTKPNDPEQKVILYHKMHNYFQKIINNSQGPQQSETQKIKEKNNNPFLKQNNPVKQQQQSILQRLFKKEIAQQKYKNSFPFTIPNIFSEQKQKKIQHKHKSTQKTEVIRPKPKYMEQQKAKTNGLLDELRKNFSTIIVQLSSKMILQKGQDSQLSNQHCSNLTVQKQSLLKKVLQSKNEFMDFAKREYPKRIKNFYQFIAEQNKNYHKQAQRYFQNNIKTLITKKYPFYPQSQQNDTNDCFNNARNKFTNQIISSKNQFQEQNLDFFYQKKKQLTSMKCKVSKLKEALQQDEHNSDFRLQLGQKMLQTMRNIKQKLTFLLEQKKKQKQQRQQIRLKNQKQIEQKKSQNEVLKAQKMKKKMKGKSKQAKMKSSMVVPKYSAFIQVNQQKHGKQHRKSKRKNSANSFAL